MRVSCSPGVPREEYIPNSKSDHKQIEDINISEMELASILTGILASGSSVKFRAHGESMFPFIRNNDLLVIDPGKERMPGIGDVVVYTQSLTGNLIIHRIVRKTGNVWHTQGDNTPDAVEDLLTKNQIQGYVRRILRDGKDSGFGLGPEKILIAILSKNKNLTNILDLSWRIRRKIFQFYK
jgi:hypothetical protein